MPVTAKEWDEVFFDYNDVVVVNSLAMPTVYLCLQFFSGYACHHVKTLAGDGDVLCEQETCSVVGFACCLCCVFDVHVLGGKSVPLQVFQFVASLPALAIATLVEHYFATTCVCQFLVYQCDCDFCHLSHKSVGCYGTQCIVKSENVRQFSVTLHTPTAACKE